MGLTGQLNSFENIALITFNKGDIITCYTNMFFEKYSFFKDLLI